MSNENRERILQAALAVLSSRGYERTTVKDIAEEAGVAPGLIHYYFKSKQQLVVAALLVCCDKIALDLGPVTDAVAAFDLLKESLRENPEFHRFFIEMVGVGLHDPEIAAGVLQFLRSDRGFVEQITSHVLGEREDIDRRTVTPLASAVWAAIFGIIVQNLVDPEFDAEASVDALALMAAATVTRLTAA
ncbi:MAG TPA: helix-turn-helix domain-containing protein [Candidatus Sulfotelmatobacter sp.]|nr:helix-turn-helix domain-containing protein [Candidatus Sulfotelmatobacter sp.]